MNFKDRTDLPEDVLKAIEDFERIKDNPDLQWEALNKQIWILDYIQGMEDATLKGNREGIKEGIELVAKNMKNQGIELDVISKTTGLTIEMIESL